jgi:mono/diheme cytochrome c family protein
MPIIKCLAAKATLPSLLVSSALFFALILSACGESTPTQTPQPASPGAVVYMRYCNTCHPGGARGAGPSVIEQAPHLSDDQLRAVVRNGKTRMPPYSSAIISDQQLSDLVAYIRTMK